jgi:hypothetical protein
MKYLCIITGTLRNYSSAPFGRDGAPASPAQPGRLSLSVVYITFKFTNLIMVLFAFTNPGLYMKGHRCQEPSEIVLYHVSQRPSIIHHEYVKEEVYVVNVYHCWSCLFPYSTRRATARKQEDQS